jgi:TorA maturation chaperone TorD
VGAALTTPPEPARAGSAEPAAAEAHARARSRAYALLARLVGGAASEPRLLDAASADATLAAAIAAYGGDLDALAADHQHVFGMSCPPFESAMLDPDGQLGRDTSDRVRRAFAAAGVAAGPHGEEPDHLATELYALALVAGAEADAVEDGEAELAARTRTHARHLLDAHLLRWLPAYASAVRRAGRVWPASLAHVIEEVALHHRSTLGPPDDADVDFDLPPLAISLDDDATGLADLARVLARPARAGGLVSRDDVARLGRSTGTPRGFGDRATLVENLLRAGAQLGSLEQVLDALSALLANARDELGADRLADVPAALRAPWRARIDETRALLATVREASRGAG